MKTQYRIINIGKGTLRLSPANLHKVGVDVFIPKATSAISGIVKTDSDSEDPTVYRMETVDNLLASKANTFTEIKTITGISYLPQLDDATKELLYEGSLPMEVTIPNNNTVPFPAGTSFYTLASGTGVLSANAAAGVTLLYKAGMSLSSVQNEIRKYTKQGLNTWLVEGSIAVSGAKTTLTYYVDSVNGNNATGSYGDATKPYATVTHVMNLADLVRNSKIVLVDPAVHYVNSIFNDKVTEIVSDVAATLSLQNSLLETPIFTNGTNLKINMPKGTIDFRSTKTKDNRGFWGCKLDLICDTFKMNTGCYIRGNPLNMRANVLIYEGGTLSPSGATFETLCTLKFTKILSISGYGTLIETGNYFLLDFDKVIDTSLYGFRLIGTVGGGELPIYINHGDYSATTSDSFPYITCWQPNTKMYINYKNDAKIIGNVVFNIGSAGSNVITFKGNAEYNSNEALINRRAFKVVFDNCVFKCKYLTAELFSNTGWNIQFIFINSYIEVDADLLVFNYGAPMEFAVASGIFKGNNTVYVRTTPNNFIRAFSTDNNMRIDIIGTLKTNGVIQQGVTINNLIP